MQVGIIGAGLSGLACAVELEKNGVDVTVFEKTNQAGGRVKTDDFEGFKLDHGFQVYLSSYEAGEYYFEYKELQLGSFSPGAHIFDGQKMSLMSDPLRKPADLFKTLFNPNATLGDKLLILKLKKMAVETKDVKLEINNQTTLEFLTKFGFSKKIIKNFFKPFFSGVFLESELKTPAGYFLYLFGRFSLGKASLPKNGMQELAIQMQRKLKKKIIFSHEAIKVTKNEIMFHDENKYNFDYVVMATDVTGLKNFGLENEKQWNSVTTSYFKTKSNQLASKYLYLNAKDNKIVNHVACLTAAQPAYAPEGWHLYSVNCVGQNLSSDNDVIKVIVDLKKIFGETEINKWDFIKSYYIKDALPTKTQFGGSVVNKNGIYYCGDHLESASIQGALVSGYKLANIIIRLR